MHVRFYYFISCARSSISLLFIAAYDYLPLMAAQYRSLPLNTAYCRPLPLVAAHCRQLHAHCRSLPLITIHCRPLPLVAAQCCPLPLTGHPLVSAQSRSAIALLGHHRNCPSRGFHSSASRISHPAGCGNAECGSAESSEIAFLGFHMYVI